MAFNAAHIAKSIPATLLAVILSFAANATGTDPLKKGAVKKDSSENAALEDRGFKDLFTSTEFNPYNPYVTQINPQVMPFVEDYLRKHQKSLESMKGWAQPYFAMMDGILQSYGLPKELKYLAVIESNLRPYALSWAGAVGPWQFMPATARRMGLRVDRHTDERTDYIKSTHAAARYLNELYSQLGDWLLVIAAYNGGPGAVNSAVKRSRSNDFWTLQYYLPHESRDHVKKFISTHYVMEGNGGQTTSTKAEWVEHQTNMAQQVLNRQTQLSPEILNNTETTEVQGRYNSVVLANQLAMDIASFNAMNPGFDQLVNSEKGYTLRLPKDRMPQFKDNRLAILYQSVLANMQQAKENTTGYPSEARIIKASAKTKN